MIGFGQHRHEFLATEARSEVARAQCRSRHGLSDPAQAVVTGKVTVTVVVFLEEIDSSSVR